MRINVTEGRRGKNERKLEVLEKGGEQGHHFMAGGWPLMGCLRLNYASCMISTSFFFPNMQ